MRESLKSGSVEGPVWVTGPVYPIMLLGMGGDYARGLAFASLIPGEPILGVHEVTPEHGMSLLLLESKMQFLAPSIQSVAMTARIPLTETEELNARYHQGRTIIKDVVVEFSDNRGNLVVRGTFRYYCRKRSTLLHAVDMSQPSLMFNYILKTSAKMVARLRALESEQAEPLFVDPFAALVAGEQARVISDRFLAVLPELQGLVAGRTHHLDQCLMAATGSVKQVICVGVGFDFRMYRHPVLLEHAHVYEIDLLEMLLERATLRAEFKLDVPHARVSEVPLNLLSDDLFHKLEKSGFDPSLPTFFIYEGCSMYFSREQNELILKSIAELIKHHPESKLWLDAVDVRVIHPDEEHPRVRDFVRGMAQLGEPFVFGLETDDPLLKDCDLEVVHREVVHREVVHREVVHREVATRYARKLPTEVFELYSFILAGPVCSQSQMDKRDI
jgi:methyltransferase (TIGR00027 family)